MATIVLKPDADPLQVADDLRKSGIVLHRRLSDNSYVAFVPGRKWLCMQYPELIPLYKEDQAFWKSVRKRNRQGEEVDPEEIYAHGKYFNQRFDEIMKKYERKQPDPLGATAR